MKIVPVIAVESYYRNWKIRGPVPGETIDGRPAAYTYWEGRCLIANTKHYARPLIRCDRDDLIRYIDEVDAYRALEEGEVERPIRKWTVIQGRDGFWYAKTKLPRGLEPIMTRAKDRTEALEKLRARVRGAGYYLVAETI